MFRDNFEIEKTRVLRRIIVRRFMDYEQESGKYIWK